MLHLYIFKTHWFQSWPHLHSSRTAELHHVVLWARQNAVNVSDYPPHNQRSCHTLITSLSIFKMLTMSRIKSDWQILLCTFTTKHHSVNWQWQVGLCSFTFILLYFYFHFKLNNFTLKKIFPVLLHFLNCKSFYLAVF